MREVIEGLYPGFGRIVSRSLIRGSGIQRIRLLRRFLRIGRGDAGLIFP